MAKMAKIESCLNCDHRILAFGPICTKLHEDIPGDAGILPGCPLENYPVERVCEAERSVLHGGWDTSCEGNPIASTNNGKYDIHTLNGCFDYISNELGLSPEHLAIIARIALAAKEGEAWRHAAICALNDPEASELNWIDRIRYWRRKADEWPPMQTGEPTETEYYLCQMLEMDIPCVLQWDNIVKQWHDWKKRAYIPAIMVTSWWPLPPMGGR